MTFRPYVGLIVQHWKTKRLAVVIELTDRQEKTHFKLRLFDGWPRETNGEAWRRIIAFEPCDWGGYAG